MSDSNRMSEMEAQELLGFLKDCINDLRKTFGRPEKTYREMENTIEEKKEEEEKENETDTNKNIKNENTVDEMQSDSNLDDHKKEYSTGLVSDKKYKRYKKYNDVSVQIDEIYFERYSIPKEGGTRIDTDCLKRSKNWLMERNWVKKAKERERELRKKRWKRFIDRKVLAEALRGIG